MCLWLSCSLSNSAWLIGIVIANFACFVAGLSTSLLWCPCLLDNIGFSVALVACRMQLVFSWIPAYGNVASLSSASPHLLTLNAWRSFACMGLNVRLVVGGAEGLLIGFFGAVLHCLCMLCMMCKAPHWLVSFPFFSGCLWFLSTWGVPLGSLALQSLWLQSLSVCFCCFRLLVLLLGELFSLRVQEVIECFWQRLLVG